MANFVQGEAVTQILPAPISGTVLGFGFDPNTGNVTVLVGYTDSDGTDQQRYFQQSELETTPVIVVEEAPVAKK
jgi:hypothetical protein